MSSLRRTLRPLAAGLASLGLVSLGLVAAPAALAHPCPEELAPVEVGLEPLDFSETDGSFVGYGTAATIRVGDVLTDGPGVQLLLPGRAGDAADAADYNLAFGGAHLAPVASASTEATVTVAGQGTNATTRELVARELYPGVTLSVTATHRRIVLRFDAETASSLEALRLQSTRGLGGETASALRDETTLALQAPTLGTGDRRTLEFETIGLDGAGEPLDARLDLDRTTGSVGVAMPATKGPASLILTALLGPHRPALDIERTDGRLGQAEAVALDAVRVEAGSTRLGALLVAVDARGSVAQTTLVDAGDLTPSGVAVDPQGRLLVVGRQLAQKGDKDEAVSSPYLGVVDPHTGSLDVVALPAVDAALDLVATHEGVSIVGTVPVGTTVALDTRQAPPFVVSTPLVEDAPAHTVALVTLDDTLREVDSIVAFDTTLALHALRVWVDCHGILHVGPVLDDILPETVTHTYQTAVQSNDLVGCPEINEGFGNWLLCWKWKINQPTWTFHPGNVAQSSVPSSLVFIKDPTDPLATGTSDHDRMNQLEANSHGNLYYDTASSSWSDPGGGWGGPNNWAYSKAELAVAAAIYHERWNSPVAANLRVTDGVSVGLRAVVLTDETFSANTAAEFPHNICDEDSDNDGVSDFFQTSWPALPEHQAATACAAAHSSSFTLDSVGYDTWRGSSVWLQNQQVAGSAPGWFTFFTPYIGDPPMPTATSGMTPAHLREISSRLAERAKVRTTVVQQHWQGGSLLSTTQRDALVPASAID